MQAVEKCSEAKSMSDKTQRTAAAQRQPMWNPFWLRRTWLGAYAILFGLIAIATLTLYIISTREKGLGAFRLTTGTVWFWKYCPTALFVAVLALWNPVDYFTRLLQPWSNLSNGPAPASRTLLLDHISPLQPVILYSAAKHREWPVVLTLSIAVALTLIKVFSTGLLVIQATSIQIKDVAFTRSATFDAGLWNTSFGYGADSIALWSGIQRENLTQPSWTSESFAVEPFMLPDQQIRSNSTYSAVTKGMFPGLDCTEAKFIREPAYLNASAGIRKANVTYRSDDCEIERTLDLADPTQWSQRQNKWAAENYMGVADVVNCSGIKRFLVAVTQADRSLTIKNYSALVCTPLHHVQDVLVHVAEDGQQDFEPQATSEVQGARINGFDATQAFSQIINATLSSNNRAASVQPSGDITEGNQPFLAVAAIPYTRSNPGSSYLRPLLDIQALNSSVASAFAGTLSLIVSEHMLRPDSDRLTGSLQYPEDRLHVEKAPSLIIAVLLLSCAGMALVMLFISPSSVVPINPNNIGGTAALIGPSSEIEDLSRTSFKETSNALDGRAFKSTFETQDQEAGQFRIIATSTTQKQRPKSSDEATESKDWCPFTLQMWVRAAAIFVCLAIIVALEILQRKSDRSSGFMDAKAGENVQLWSTVVPALLLTGLALLYSSIYTNIAVLAPYHALAGTKGAIAKRSIATEYLGSTPLFAIPPAVQQGHISTSVSAFAAVVGAFLTIVVSGLYYTQIVESRVPLEVQRGDEWNVTWPVGESDGAAGQTLQFTTWRNLTNPQWTHEDLVLPKVSLPTSEGNLSNNQKLTVVLPARRARLNCTATKPADVVISVDSSFTRVYSKVLNTCAGQSQQELPLALSISRPLDSYGGSDPLQLYFDPRGTFATAQIPSSKVPIANLANSSCPSIAFFFGSLPDTAPAQTNQTRLPMSPTRNLTSSEASGMTLACAQLIEEVDTAVTFLLPEWSIDQSAPIVPDESSTRQIGGVYQFPAVSSLISTFGVSSSNTTFQGDIMRHFGTFFAAVVHGKDGIPAEELLADEDRLIGAVSKLYGRYMAQVMTRKMRSPTGEQVFEASVTQQRARLMQHSSAKLGLQILLGVIVLCDLVSWAMMRRVRILPHSPCSIAGIACLLAGREFWGEKKQNWAADTRVFKIGLHNDKFGIYAMNDGGEHLRS